MWQSQCHERKRGLCKRHGRQSGIRDECRHHGCLFPIIEKAAGIISGAIPPDDSDGWAGLSAIVTTEVEGDPGKWMRELGWAVRDLDGDNLLFIGMITGNLKGGKGNKIVAIRL